MYAIPALLALGIVVFGVGHLLVGAAAFALANPILVMGSAMAGAAIFGLGKCVSRIMNGIPNRHFISGPSLALKRAIDKGDINMIKKLTITMGTNPNANIYGNEKAGTSPLSYAIEIHRDPKVLLPVMKTLIEVGANPGGKDSFGSPLDKAICRRSFNAARLLQDSLNAASRQAHSRDIIGADNCGYHKPVHRECVSRVPSFAI